MSESRTEGQQQKPVRRISGRQLSVIFLVVVLVAQGAAYWSTSKKLESTRKGMAKLLKEQAIEIKAMESEINDERKAREQEFAAAALARHRNEAFQDSAIATIRGIADQIAAVALDLTQQQRALSQDMTQQQRKTTTVVVTASHNVEDQARSTRAAVRKALPVKGPNLLQKIFGAGSSPSSTPKRKSKHAE